MLANHANLATLHDRADISAHFDAHAQFPPHEVCRSIVSPYDCFANAVRPAHSAMRSGFAYASVPIYRLVMRLLYAREYHRKYQAVADLIPSDATVVDLCAGDCLLASKLAVSRDRYLALELNPRFVAWAQRAGIEARIFDAVADPIPTADVICIQSSLYQFIPNESDLIRRMIASAHTMVIISEPVVNLATSGNSFLARLAARATAVNGRTFPHRHTLQSLTQLLREVAPQAELAERQRRDAIFVIRKETPEGHAS